jgi:hypothetical protein
VTGYILHHLHHRIFAGLKGITNGLQCALADQIQKEGGGDGKTRGQEGVKERKCELSRIQFGGDNKKNTSENGKTSQDGEDEEERIKVSAHHLV